MFFLAFCFRKIFLLFSTSWRMAWKSAWDEILIRSGSQEGEGFHVKDSRANVVLLSVLKSRRFCYFKLFHIFLQVLTFLATWKSATHRYSYNGWWWCIMTQAVCLPFSLHLILSLLWNKFRDGKKVFLLYVKNLSLRRFSYPGIYFISNYIYYSMKSLHQSC